MTPQQRHERAIDALNELNEEGVSHESELYQFILRRNDEAVAAFYGLTVEQLETNIQVCWR